MAKLNPQAKKDLAASLRAAHSHPMRQFNTLLRDVNTGKVKPDKGTFLHLASLYADSVKGMPLCFWTRLYELVEDKINPEFHVRECEHWDSGKGVCLLGHSESECEDDCPDYAGKVEHWCDELDCDGDCGSDLKLPG